MKKLILLFVLSALLSKLALAQSVTIDPSATGGSNIIQATAPNKALKLPSVAGTSNIDSPQAGQMIYNQSTASPNYYNGSTWQNMVGGPIPSNIYPNSEYFGNPNSGAYGGTGAFLDSYTWIVPAGVTKIWAEIWGGGGSGPIHDFTFYSSQIGGNSGAYLSVLINVTPGEQLNIYAGKGRSQSGNYDPIPSSIYRNIVEIAGLTLTSFNKAAGVAVLNYQQSVKGGSEKISSIAPGPYSLSDFTILS
jgi:hypothetical protein